jgi:hypothetical protein
VNAPFGNIHFVYNALARPGQPYYGCSEALGTILSRVRRV